MNTHRALKWGGGLILAMLVLLALVAAFFDWNRLRDPIARRVGSATGRTFAINGDLDVRLALRPRIIANDVVIGNAAWGREPTMAGVRRLDFRIDLLELLAGKVNLPDVTLSDAHVVLEVSKDGTPNWVFGPQDKSKPIQFPVIGALTIDRGSATYRDPANDTDLAFDVKTLDAGNLNQDAGLELNGKGRFKGLATTIRARGGALLSLRSADQPYPFKASGTLGATRASADGMLLDPLHLKGERMNFKLEGSDLARLFPIIGVPIPPTPAYRLAGFLDHTGDLWAFRGFSGTVGQSDLAGDFAVDRGKHPQLITASLVSKKLVMRDLGGFIGASRGGEPDQSPPPDDKVLPTEPFSLTKLQAADADVKFRGEKILTEKTPLQNMRAHLTVKNGVLKLSPLEFGVAGGSLVSQLEMDARNPRLATRADIAARGLHLGQMFPNSRFAGADTGTMGGRARLAGGGNSISQMIGSANGEAALIMDGGTVSELLLRLSNLDIANSLVVLVGGDRQVPIRCMVGNFKAVDGDFRVETLVLDTPKVNITGSGDVNFADESLHLRLVSRSKGFSLASLRGPLVVTGPLKSPAVHPEMGQAVARGGLAVALGVVTAGVGALIPLLEFGTGRHKDANCIALMNEAKADAGVKTSDIAPRGAGR